MPFQSRGGVRYYTFDSLDDSRLLHAVFTRQGGVSPAPWTSLNVGGTVGDEKERVVENRHRSFYTLDRRPESLFDVWQVHGVEIVCAEGARPVHADPIKADGILTDRPEVTVFMRFADCVPILLHDPKKQVAGVVHAGWQGTVKKAAAAAVHKMTECYGSRPEDILAAIGPSIGPDHYEVGPDVIARVQAAFGEGSNALLPALNGAVQFDLWSANRLVLEESGVRSIEMANLCTACHLEDWYSHRAEHGKTGRFGVLIALRA